MEYSRPFRPMYLKQVIICPSVPGTVLVDGCCPDIIITSILFHSQKFFHLDITFYGHPIYGESMVGVLCREKYRKISRLVSIDY